MNEFETVIFKKNKDQRTDRRFIQMVLLLSTAFLVLYIFDPSPTRNIVLFVIVAWGFLLHFSYHTLSKEYNASSDSKLLIGGKGIIIGEKELGYDIINRIDIYIDGYENQHQYPDQKSPQNEEAKNRIVINSNGKTYTELFKIYSKEHGYELIQALNSLNESVTQKIYLHKASD